MILPAKSCTCGTKFVPKSKQHKYCSEDCRKGKAAQPDAPQYTLTDASNHMLTLGPSAMSCGVVETTEGPRLLLTVRTPSTTLTIGLTRQDAVAWITEFVDKANAMNDPEAA